jgi:predicted MFS family arabinose efflux permease
VWRAPGMVDLAVMSMFGFSGYAALLAVAPLWVVEGGSTAAGAGLVNGVLLAATVLTQLAVPRALATWGTGRVLVTGLLLLGLPAPAYLLSDELGWVLGLSAVRGAGFGILTVVGSTVVAQLVPVSRRGAAIGVYGLSVAVPNLLLLPGSVPIVDRWGFAPVFWMGALPLLGVPAVVRLMPALSDAGRGGPSPAARGSRPSARAVLGIVPPTVVLFSVTMAGGALLTFSPQLAQPRTAALVLLIFGVTAALSRWLAGSVADRFGGQRFLAPILTCAAAAMAVCAWAVARGQDVPLVAAATVLGVCYGALQNLTLVVAFAAVEPSQLAAASAGWNIGFDAGTGLGSVLAGALAAAYSFPVALATLAALCLLAVPLALVPLRRAGTDLVPARPTP